MDGLLWVWAYVLAKVVQSDSTVRRLPVSWAFASPPLVFYCLFLYLSGFVRCSKGNDSLDDYDYGEEDSEEWETEDEESDEPDADGGSAEEDDEDSVK